MAVSDVYRIDGYTVRLTALNGGGVGCTIRGGTGKWTVQRFWKDAPLVAKLSGLDGSLTLQKARDWIAEHPRGDVYEPGEECVTERDMYPWEAQAVNPAQEHLLKQQQMYAAARILNAKDCYTVSQVKERLMKLKETEHPDHGDAAAEWEKIVSTYQFLSRNLPKELPQRRTTEFTGFDLLGDGF
ncbi:hypothetical protein MITS9509_00988 [Synechococcus sp. MIT S9509]|uniref:hypothetical protein n=1 Tax=Synechococcus sp. MIT S9509 TaxID=1801630 RepID=UPI0007BC1992|nr:hypothetical protein [Synechococcus sp. MIT S9509]KZR93111.1 hypothetical protein MITS9509_00988 [Synechococcus sp. MIT S9509]